MDMATTERAFPVEISAMWAPEIPSVPTDFFDLDGRVQGVRIAQLEKIRPERNFEKCVELMMTRSTVHGTVMTRSAWMFESGKGEGEDGNLWACIWEV